MLLRLFCTSHRKPVSSQAFYVSSRKTYEIEEPLNHVKSQWLGKKLFEDLVEGHIALEQGSAAMISRFGEHEGFHFISVERQWDKTVVSHEIKMRI
jgi:hypothetical protein